MQTSALEHLLTRLMTVFYQAGATQKEADHLLIPRNEVLCAGRSQYQDRNSSDKRLHASHVIRIQLAQKMLSKLEGFPDLHEDIKTHFGYTELVEKWANMWGGIGQNIDELQAPLLKLLEVVDFSQDPPCLIGSIPESYYKETLNDLYEQLKKIETNDSVIMKFHSTISPGLIVGPGEIVELCIQYTKIVVRKWLKFSGNHFMNKASIKDILSQLNVLLRTSNTNHLLQLGRDGYKNYVQQLSAAPKENGVANGNNDVSSNSVNAVWGPVKEMARSVIGQLPWLSTVDVLVILAILVIMTLIISLISKCITSHMDLSDFRNSILPRLLVIGWYCLSFVFKKWK